MEQIKVRKRRPVRPATIASYRSVINKWIVCHLGNERIEDVGNGALKRFNLILREAELKPASINLVLNVLKMIISSAVDDEGDELHPVKWNLEFIDAPIVVKSEQDTPTLRSQAITEAISRALGADKALYALLGGSGLRISEALALKAGEDNQTDSFWLPAESKLTIRTTVSLGKIQQGTKTLAGIREIDLSEQLNNYLRAHLVSRPGLLFPSSVGGVACQRTGYSHLVEAGIEEAFHAFRRFRVSQLRKNRVPEDLIQYWIGHAKETVTDGYSKLAEDVELRRYWVEKAGLGFEL